MKRWEEAITAICEGRHILGCEQYLFDYNSCNCYHEIAMGAKEAVDLDLEDPKPAPEIPNSGVVRYQLGDMTHLTCIQCKAPYAFEDWRAPTSCACGGFDQSGHPYPTMKLYTVEEASVLVRWTDTPKPTEG
jgi:hypothetical protein